MRDHGYSDAAIHDAFQVVGYFNYINRLADSLGVDLEPEMPAVPEGWEREWPADAATGLDSSEE